MAHRHAWLLVALSASVAVGVGAQGPQAPPYRPDKPIAIVGGLLIDATGAPPRMDQTVVIQGERIVEIGPMETVRVPPGAEVIDAAGMTVMPGLINSNQHIQLNPLFPSPPANMPLANFKGRWERNWARQPYHAFVYLMQGITSLRNTSGPAKQIVPVKHAIDRGEIPGPRLFLGAALFQSEVSFKAYAAQQKTPADALPFVRDEFAFHVVADVDADTRAYEGPDFNYWKLIMSDRTTSPTSSCGRSSPRRTGSGRKSTSTAAATTTGCGGCSPSTSTPSNTRSTAPS